LSRWAVSRTLTVRTASRRMRRPLLPISARMCTPCFRTSNDPLGAADQRQDFISAEPNTGTEDHPWVVGSSGLYREETGSQADFPLPGLGRPHRRATVRVTDASQVIA